MNTVEVALIKVGKHAFACVGCCLCLPHAFDSEAWMGHVLCAVGFVSEAMNDIQYH